LPDEALLFLNTAIAIVGIVVSITWLKFPPVFALLFGTLYLGLTTAVEEKGTPEAVAAGFADVMGDIGILVTFGVVLGALLTVTNTMQRLVEAMLKAFGNRSVPYVFAATLSSMFTSIYSDVLLVLSAPLARRLGPRLGPKGRALMGGSLTAGIEVGLVFVAPGVAAVAIAGILDDVPLGQMFLVGLAVGLPTALLTMLVFAAVLRLMKWEPEFDEVVEVAEADEGESPGPLPVRRSTALTAVASAARTASTRSPPELERRQAVRPAPQRLSMLGRPPPRRPAGWRSGRKYGSCPFSSPSHRCC